MDAAHTPLVSHILNSMRQVVAVAHGRGVPFPECGIGIAVVLPEAVAADVAEFLAAPPHDPDDPDLIVCVEPTGEKGWAVLGIDDQLRHGAQPREGAPLMAEIRFEPLDARTWPGKPTNPRKQSLFGCGYQRTLDELHDELRRVGASACVVELEIHEGDVRRDGALPPNRRAVARIRPRPSSPEPGSGAGVASGHHLLHDGRSDPGSEGAPPWPSSTPPGGGSTAGASRAPTRT